MQELSEYLAISADNAADWACSPAQPPDAVWRPSARLLVKRGFHDSYRFFLNAAASGRTHSLTTYQISAMAFFGQVAHHGLERAKRNPVLLGYPSRKENLLDSSLKVDCDDTCRGFLGRKISCDHLRTKRRGPVDLSSLPEALSCGTGKAGRVIYAPRQNVISVSLKLQDFFGR